MDKRSSLFSIGIKNGISYALNTLVNRYDKPPDPLNRLYYHNSQHSTEVAEKTEQILNLINHCSPGLVSGSQILLAKFAAFFHDINQDWERVEDSYLGAKTIKRKKVAGEIEEKSYLEASEYLQQFNKAQNEQIFTQADNALVKECIYITIPEFDRRLGTVYQPNFTTNSSVPAMAVALADLGVPAIDGFNLFLRDTDSLFLEENVDFFETLHSRIFPNNTEHLRERIIQWTRRQLVFVQGRKIRNARELGYIPESARLLLKEMFSQFDSTIKFMESVLGARQKMSYEELLAHCRFKELIKG